MIILVLAFPWKKSRTISTENITFKQAFITTDLQKRLGGGGRRILRLVKQHRIHQIHKGLVVLHFFLLLLK